MTQEELKPLKKYSEDNLTKGFIQTSSSPAAATVLVFIKLDGSLCLYVDCRGLTQITITNRYPVPLIREILDWLVKGKLYT
jgi:hypothetical protein